MELGNPEVVVARLQKLKKGVVARLEQGVVEHSSSIHLFLKTNHLAWPVGMPRALFVAWPMPQPRQSPGPFGDGQACCCDQG